MSCTRSAPLPCGRDAASAKANPSVRRPAPHAPRRPSPIPLHRLALAALALLCVFVIAAGIAVARLLPRRLELWDVTRVGAGRATAPAAPLRRRAGRGAAAARPAPRPRPG